MAELESALDPKAIELGRVLAWNFAYLDCRCGLYQETFERNNPGLDHRITADNYEIREGKLFVR